MRALLLLLCACAAVLADEYHPPLGMEAASGRTASNRAEDTAQYWSDEAQAAIRAKLGSSDERAARGLIMFLGDGMSVPTLAAARALLGQRRGETGEEAQLSFEAFPTVGLTKTYCVNAQIADSACTATAYLAGVKNNYGTVGVTAAVRRGECQASREAAHRVRSIAAWALDAGRDVGIVTTTRVTHASPSGAHAKAADRNWESDADVRAAGHDPADCPDIADQLVNHHPGNQFKVILGGGRRAFLPMTTTDEEGVAGRRTDGRNLIDEWLSSRADRGLNASYVWHRSQLAAAADHVLGLFESNHLMYNLETDPESEPTLAEMTAAAIERLQTNPRGYFLFVEGGRIDHAHHATTVHMALDETLQFAEAVETAAATAADDTLLVVTADHAHVMAYNGYSARGADVLGAANWARDAAGVPYLTLSYTNGPGFRAHSDGVRADVTQEEGFESRATRWEAHVDAPLSSETHGGDDVAVFARGPQHQLFTGLYEQTHVPHLMAYAGCIGPGARAPACAAAAAAPAAAAPLAATLAAAALAALFVR